MGPPQRQLTTAILTQELAMLSTGDTTEAKHENLAKIFVRSE